MALTIKTSYLVQIVVTSKHHFLNLICGVNYKMTTTTANQTITRVHNNKKVFAYEIVFHEQ